MSTRTSNRTDYVTRVAAQFTPASLAIHDPPLLACLAQHRDKTRVCHSEAKSSDETTQRYFLPHHRASQRHRRLYRGNVRCHDFRRGQFALRGASTIERRVRRVVRHTGVPGGLAVQLRAPNFRPAASFYTWIRLWTHKSGLRGVVGDVAIAIRETLEWAVSGNVPGVQDVPQ